MLDPQKGTYFPVLAVNQNYTKGLSLWQHRVIRRFAQRQLNDRIDLLALAQAKADIRALVERDFNRKSTRGRKRHARFLEVHSKPLGHVSVAGTDPNRDQNAVSPEAAPDTGLEPHQQAEAAPMTETSSTSEEILPLFESGLDLPRLPATAIIRAGEASERKNIQ